MISYKPVPHCIIAVQQYDTASQIINYNETRSVRSMGLFIRLRNQIHSFPTEATTCLIFVNEPVQSYKIMFWTTLHLKRHQLQHFEKLETRLDEVPQLNRTQLMTVHSTMYLQYSACNLF